MKLEYKANSGWKECMNEIKELATALAKAQGSVENAKKVSNNPHFKSKYADLATIWDVIREPLTSNGLAVLQFPCQAPEGHVGLRTIVTHCSGQSVEDTFYLGLKDATNPQQVGSALTYMKRYSLLGVAGIGSEDDDGNAATGRTEPAVTSAPAVDYTKTIEEAMARLEKATNEEAQVLYATVRNSGMHQPAKNELLVKMATAIQARSKTPANTVTKEEGKKNK